MGDSDVIDSDESTWDTDAQVARLRASAGAALDPLFRNDAQACRRFLRACRGDAAQAATLLLEHQEWRRLETPRWPAAQVDEGLVRGDVASGKGFVHGRDRRGHPLGWIRVSLHDAAEPREEVANFTAFLLDELVARAEASSPDDPRFSIVIDFAEFSRSNFDSGTALALLRTLRANYPERLARLYIINNGLLFWALWKVIEVFLDERSARKVSILGGDYLAALREDVDDAEIQSWAGGSSAYEYDPGHVAASASGESPNVYISLTAAGPTGGRAVELKEGEASAFPRVGAKG